VSAQPLLVDDGAPPPQIRDGAIEVSAVEQANASRHEMSADARCDWRSWLRSRNRPSRWHATALRQCVTGLTLVEHVCRVGAQALSSIHTPPVDL
jgi:hypothetical protein